MERNPSVSTLTPFRSGDILQLTCSIIATQMMKMKNAKDSRRKRLRPNPGMWTPISLELGRIVSSHLKESKGIDPAKRMNRIPIYIIPILFSYLRALAIETENQKEMYGKGEYTSKLLSALETNPSNEVITICKRFNVSSELKKSAEILNHIRHEIIHPSLCWRWLPSPRVFAWLGKKGSTLGTPRSKLCLQHCGLLLLAQIVELGSVCHCRYCPGDSWLGW